MLPFLQQKNSEPLGPEFCGGDEGDRTPYLLHAMQALSQVSYTPTGLAVIADSFISIAAFSLFVKHFFEFFS